MAESKHILVIGEVEREKLTSTSRELLGGARRLAGQMGGMVNLLLMGPAVSAAQEGIQYGADKVYTAQDAIFSEFNSDACTQLTGEICRKIRPMLCLFGQSDLGRDVAPRLAAKLDAGLCMDCVEIIFDAGSNRLLQTRPVFGGKAMAVMATSGDRLQVNTVRAKSIAPEEPKDERKGEVISVTDGVDASLIKVKLVESKRMETEGVKLEDAKIIVAGGGGLGGPEGFEMIGQLAKLMGGVVGATRVPVDENWVPLSMEIGQTGKIVSPDLYIAIGISGAAQHVTGIVNSKKIVAINKDPDANIFRMADVGLVADYKVAVPILIEKLKAGR
ncbi:MAG: electron transfer flavoprotein subunit alpha/FixB family protein [Deltaproteobacteria bacterium]|nr:electron transfer flavoprotein subunit alpha/FixB family protein [Deltaproteobacteria bacterium]